MRAFLHAYDTATAFECILEKGKIGEIYNIGGNKKISVRQFLNELIKLAKCEIKTELDKCSLLCSGCHKKIHKNIDRFNQLKNEIIDRILQKIIGVLFTLILS